MLKWHPGRGRFGRSFATLDTPVQNFSVVNGNVLDINFKQLGSQISTDLWQQYYEDFFTFMFE